MLTTCFADSSGAGLLDVLASAELLQQGGEAMCQKIASTLLTHFSSNSQVQLRSALLSLLLCIRISFHMLDQLLRHNTDIVKLPGFSNAQESTSWP